MCARQAKLDARNWEEAFLDLGREGTREGGVGMEGASQQREGASQGRGKEGTDGRKEAVEEAAHGMAWPGGWRMAAWEWWRRTDQGGARVTT